VISYQRQQEIEQCWVSEKLSNNTIFIIHKEFGGLDEIVSSIYLGDVVSHQAQA
jgi:hypothetical protein